MRRTLTILSVLLISNFFMACGERSTSVTNANASAGSNMTGASNSGAGDSAGTGPKTQGIGGTGEGNTNAVSANTYTVPPGFNNNGDRGSASNVSTKP